MLPIIMNIADDDDRAFVEQIYIKYEKKLYLIAIKYVRDHYDAEDCVHDTVKVIIENIERFRDARDRGYLEPLLTVVCRNRAVNIMHKKASKNEYEQPVVRYIQEEGSYEDLEIPDYDSAVDRVYISEQNCQHLKELIDKLDDKYRDIVLLKSIGLDGVEIANVMNISKELVRQRYCRAKKLLWEMGGKNLYVR